ncbi:MAG: leucine--tRNA ligase [Candidatus Berkelbacteria bacterium]|nr:leucine--tRNA ligase [Candidatus Berkelbacteria bacterium]
MKKYEPAKIRDKWQKIWEETGAHKAKEAKNRPKFYCLDMFPYPSGAGLHVGHWRGYVLSDVIARYQKLHGKSILHPMGYDAFGLPAENAAIKSNRHPKEFTLKAIERFREQLKQIGAMYDWSREINSSEPQYYKWTQWIFLQLYNAGLAYRKKAPVNWCGSCQTGLANEQVVGGECERCQTKVTKKELTQWFFKITKYAEKLLNNLTKLDWPERTKILQTNWIGKSEGALLKFKVDQTDLEIEVFTTRIDTLFGSTFMVLAPENKVVQAITHPKYIDEVQNYIEKTKNESDVYREKEHRKKTGVFTGAYAINPINSKKIPIWISDYVLMGYGTGAVMCVPGHDKRDFDFAKKFNLEITQVISPNGKKDENILPYLDNGVLINSGKYNGLKSAVAKNTMIKDLNSVNSAEFQTNFRLRDWLISRQRYWGAPIPIVYCDMCGEVPVDEKDLPVLLPENIEFKPKGDSPLKQSKEFVNTKCPKCGTKAMRETDTMDTFVDSSWYFLRFTDPQNLHELSSSKNINTWMPVDLYIGGIEHATMHLLYARFISMALHDLKILGFDKDGEPFKKLFNIGLIYLHGAKMSKSKGNVINPDELVEKYSSDALRGYEMFVGPNDQDSEWQVSGIVGIYRFLEKVWQYSLSTEFKNSTSRENLSIINFTIKKVTQDIENFRINTAIASLMSAFNHLDNKISKKDYGLIIQILSPIFPHIAEEIWQELGNHKSVFESYWPVSDKSKVILDNINLAVQVNGKLKDIILVTNNIDEESAKNAALTEKVKSAINNKNIYNIIYIPGKIINFVLK